MVLHASKHLSLLNNERCFVSCMHLVLSNIYMYDINDVLKDGDAKFYPEKILPVGTPGFKSRIRPPYPQRVVKGD